MFTSSLFCLLHSVPNSYPQLQTSIAGVYLSSPSRSSGGRYHNVITLLVYGRLLGGAKKEDYHFTTISFLEKWYFEGFNSVVLLQDSAMFHFFFNSAKLQLHKSKCNHLTKASKRQPETSPQRYNKHI